MSKVTVRPAVFGDWPAIVEFNCWLAEETENKQLDVAIIRSGVQAVLADPGKGRYFVACRNGRIVGQIMYTREWSDWRNGEIWWLQSVYVAVEFRRQGVFRMLYEHALRKAETDPNVVGLRLYVEQDNSHAQKTYNRLGMRRPGYFVMERLFEH